MCDSMIGGLKRVCILLEQGPAMCHFMIGGPTMFKQGAEHGCFKLDFKYPI